MFLVLLLAGALVLQSRNAVIAADSQRSTQVISTSDHAMRLVEDAGRGITSFQRSHAPANLAPFYAMRRQLPNTLDALHKMVQPWPEERIRALRLITDLRNGEALLEAYLRAVQARDAALQKRLATSPKTQRLSTDLALALEEFNNTERVTTAQRLSELHRQVEIFAIVLVVLCLFGIAVTLAVSARYGLTITRRLMRLADNARRLALGESTEPIAGDDEIAQLDRVYQEMTQRIQREHATASTLQRALLPQDLPALPGIRLDAAYVPAAGGAEVGGDWYDVFSISDRIVGISIGDVAGHGLRASTLMGCARQAIRTLAYIYDDPATVMSHVNGVLYRTDGSVLVTAFFATLDLHDGTLRYSVAGHPQPAIVRPGGEIETLAGKGFVLGIEPGATFETCDERVAPGSGLVLYTDGVVELERDYFKGLENLHAAIREEHRNGAGNIAEAIQSRIFATAPPRDDSALLFVAVTALGPEPGKPQHRTWNVDARVERAARGVKRALLWELGTHALPGEDLSAAELVFSELLGNVARHTPGPAEITLEWHDGSAVIRVRDNGSRFEPPQEAADILAESGRGLLLARAISRELTVEWTGSGNRVSAVLPISIRTPA